MKVQELLTDESKWNKGCYARNASGNEVSISSTDASCWCLSGAIHKCYGDTWDVHDIICKKLNAETVCSWNDAPGRTFNDIKSLIEELDI